MFADPQSLTFEGVAFSFVRVKSDAYSSEYHFSDATQQIVMLIRNNPSSIFKKTGKSTGRHNVEIVCTIFPTVAGALPTIRRVSLTFDLQDGDAVVHTAGLINGLAGWLSASSNAAVGRLANMES
jgi:hypothetical protein